jgi:hypothetical protein
MAIFRKRSEAEKQLESYCGSIASALVQSADGSMPPDFVHAIAEGHADEIRRLYAIVVGEQGDKIALKASIKHARMVADIWARDRPVNSAIAVRETENMIRGIIS